MKELIIDVTLTTLKLKFRKNIFEKVLDAFIPLIMTAVFPPFVFFGIYSTIKGHFDIGFLFLPILGLLFFVWFVIGWINKGEIKEVVGVSKTQAINWAAREIKNKKIRELLNRVNENYIGLRYNGLSVGAFKRDVYLIFEDDKVYVTSIAIGSGDEISPFHFSANKSKTEDIIAELQAIEIDYNESTPTKNQTTSSIL